jgi:hypothetical protein
MFGEDTISHFFRSLHVLLFTAAAWVFFFFFVVAVLCDYILSSPVVLFVRAHLSRRR